MTIYELHLGYKERLDKASSGAYPDISSESVDEFINRAYSMLIKERYNGLNASSTSYEETQKRKDDLAHLVVSVNLVRLAPKDSHGNNIISEYYSLPSDYWITVSENVDIKPKGCNLAYERAVFMASHNQRSSILADPFQRPKLSKTVSFQEEFNGTQCKVLFRDADSLILKYKLTYLRQYIKLQRVDSREFAGWQNGTIVRPPAPTYHALNTINDVQILVNGVTTTLKSWRLQEYWAALQLHEEIIDKAVQLTLETIESPRLNSFSQVTVNHE